MLTKEQILAAVDLKTQEVPVPEWGGSVFVRSMTGLERDAFGSSLRNPDGSSNLDNYYAKLIVACVVDEAGNQLFTADDAKALAAKNSIALQRVFKVAEELNYLTQASVGELEKN